MIKDSISLNDHDNAPIRVSNFHPGQYVDVSNYRVFHPSFINREWIWDDSETLEMMHEAYSWLDKMGQATKDLRFLPQIQLVHLKYEATMSCRLSYMTPAAFTFRDALCQSDYVSPNLIPPWRIINENYIKSFKYIYDILMSGRKATLENLGLINVQLLDNTIFANMEATSTKYRTKQSWMGSGMIDTADYIPPEPLQIPSYMEDMYAFWLTPDNLHYLLKIAVCFYQMVNVMPYLYGNHLQSRLLFTTVGAADKLTPGALLCMTEFFAKTQPGQHYAPFMARARQGHLLEWVSFFLSGVIETAKTECERLKAIGQLQHDLMADIAKQPPRAAVQMERLSEILFAQPIVTISEANRQLGLSRPTTSKFFMKLQHLGWLNETTGDTRYRMFQFDRYIELFEKQAETES